MPKSTEKDKQRFRSTEGCKAEREEHACLQMLELVKPCVRLSGSKQDQEVSVPGPDSAA